MVSCIANVCRGSNASSQSFKWNSYPSKKSSNLRQLRDSALSRSRLWSPKGTSGSVSQDLAIDYKPKQSKLSFLQDQVYRCNKTFLFSQIKPPIPKIAPGTLISRYESDYMPVLLKDLDSLAELDGCIQIKTPSIFQLIAC